MYYNNVLYNLLLLYTHIWRIRLCTCMYVYITIIIMVLISTDILVLIWTINSIDCDTIAVLIIVRLVTIIKAIWLCNCFYKASTASIKLGVYVCAYMGVHVCVCIYVCTCTCVCRYVNMFFV